MLFSTKVFFGMPKKVSPSWAGKTLRNISPEIRQKDRFISLMALANFFYSEYIGPMMLWMKTCPLIILMRYAEL